MGKYRAQKGFLLIVVVLLAATFFASLYNDSTGEAVRTKRTTIATKQPLSYQQPQGGEDSGSVLIPGTGWTGPTPIPGPIGNPLAQGHDATAIAHSDMVPFQTTSTTMNIGVLAYHINGIEKVSFSVNNGPWVDVFSPTLNPETEVEEYWAVLDASQFLTDGPVEIRAIAYPINGYPKVLQGTTIIDHDSSIILNVNPSGSLPHRVRYVSTTGSDSSTCGLTSATACLTIRHAADLAAIYSGVPGQPGNLDGAELRLGEGTWIMPEFRGTGLIPFWQPAFRTTTRWFTITSSETVNPDNVLIDEFFGPADGPGLWLKQVRLYDVSLVGHARTPQANFEDYFWVDNSKAYFLGNVITNNLCGAHFQGYDAFTSTYFTDVYMDNTCNGPQDAVLVRHVFADHTGAGHASKSHTVIDYTVNRVYGSLLSQIPPGYDYHGDYYQMYSRYQDIIIKGGGTLPGALVSSRGIVDEYTANHLVKDVVIDGIYLDVNQPGIMDGWVFSYCDRIDHMIIQDSTLIGSSNWCGELGGTPNPLTMHNLLIKDSIFENGNIDKLPHPILPQIRYITSPANSPTKLFVTTLSTSQLRLKWMDNSNNENHFEVERLQLPNGIFAPLLPASSLPANTVTFTDTGLPPSTSFAYRVRAVNAAGPSAWSNIANGKVM